MSIQWISRETGDARVMAGQGLETVLVGLVVACNLGVLLLCTLTGGDLVSRCLGWAGVP
jgi:hypothetical protein